MLMYRGLAAAPIALFVLHSFPEVTSSPVYAVTAVQPLTVNRRAAASGATVLELTIPQSFKNFEQNFLFLQHILYF